MGQLKTRLTNLTAMGKAVAKTAEDVYAKQLALASDVGHALDVEKEGRNAAFMHLVEKLKKQGKKIDAHLNDRISAHLDPTLGKFLKGIENARAKAERSSGSWTQTVGTLKADMQRYKTALLETRALVEKKKGNWLKSKLFKAKFAQYDAVLGKLIKGYQTDLIPACEEMENPDAMPLMVSAIKSLKIKPDDPVKVLRRMEIYEMYKEAEKRVKAGMVVARKRRNPGNFTEAISTMAKWAGEAESMESESEG